MAKPKVCISFDYENDLNYRNTFNLWNNNKNIEFSINDKTPKEIDSYNISRIKAGLTLKINESDVLLIISGKSINTLHKDKVEIGCINWQNWECKKAIDLNKKIILLKLDTSCEVPIELYGKDRENIIGLELEKVNGALNNIFVK